MLPIPSLPWDDDSGGGEIRLTSPVTYADLVNKNLAFFLTSGSTTRIAGIYRDTDNYIRLQWNQNVSAFVIEPFEGETTRLYVIPTGEAEGVQLTDVRRRLEVVDSPAVGSYVALDLLGYADTSGYIFPENKYLVGKVVGTSSNLPVVAFGSDDADGFVVVDEWGRASSNSLISRSGISELVKANYLDIAVYDTSLTINAEDVDNVAGIQRGLVNIDKSLPLSQGSGVTITLDRPLGTDIAMAAKAVIENVLQFGLLYNNVIQLAVISQTGVGVLNIQWEAGSAVYSATISEDLKTITLRNTAGSEGPTLAWLHRVDPAGVERLIINNKQNFVFGSPVSNDDVYNGALVMLDDVGLPLVAHNYENTSIRSIAYGNDSDNLTLSYTYNANAGSSTKYKFTFDNSSNTFSLSGCLKAPALGTFKDSMYVLSSSGQSAQVGSTGVIAYVFSKDGVNSYVLLSQGGDNILGGHVPTVGRLELAFTGSLNKDTQFSNVPGNIISFAHSVLKTWLRQVVSFEGEERSFIGPLYSLNNDGDHNFEMASTLMTEDDSFAYFGDTGPVYIGER